MTGAAPIPVEQLPNLGPTSAQWLREVGICTRADLERVGAAAAFRRVRALDVGASRNLLYALAGVLAGVEGRDLPAAVKAQLDTEAGL